MAADVLRSSLLPCAEIRSRSLPSTRNAPTDVVRLLTGDYLSRWRQGILDMAARIDQIITHLTAIREQLENHQAQASRHAERRDTLVALRDLAQSQLHTKENEVLVADQLLTVAKDAHQAVLDTNSSAEETYRAAHVVFQQAVKIWEAAKAIFEGHTREYQATICALSSARETRDATQSARADQGLLVTDAECQVAEAKRLHATENERVAEIERQLEVRFASM